MKKSRIFLFIYLMFIFGVNLPAQNRGELEIKTSNGNVVSTFSQGYALVIGEVNYKYMDPLKSIKNEINIVKGLLEGQNFIVETFIDKTSDELKNGIQKFLNDYGMDESARLVLFFAGHGATYPLQGKEVGYIVPIDTPTFEDNQKGFFQKAISMDLIQTWVNTSRCRHILFIFDSCFSGTIFTTRSEVLPPSISYEIIKPVRQFITAGSENETTPPVSVLVPLLERALKDGEADLDKDGYITGTELGYYLRKEVINRNRGQWHPQYGKSHDTRWDKGDFIFVSGKPQPLTGTPQQPSPQTPKAPVINEDLPLPANFVRIEGGTFTMGSPLNEPIRYDNEVQHRVTVSSFYMGKYQVTQAEYEAVMGTNPSNFKGSNLPVENVSWYDAVEYCNKLSQKENLTPAYIIDKGRSDINNTSDSDTVRWLITWNQNANGYRLPTEAEWEYACRAGTTTPFNTGNNITTGNANYDGNYPYNKNAKGTYRQKTTPVGSFAPNPWGLYDMHGNVWEWCWDWYGSNYYSSSPASNPAGAVSGALRVVRGGGWNYSAADVRSAWRSYYTPSNRLNFIGFRLVRP